MSSLVDRIRAEIAERGPISFARFMERALYDPDGGYYARTATPIGREGDYFTASDAGRAFGACLARQLVEIDRTLGPFDPFHVVEVGAGRGLLARDLLDAAPTVDRGFASRLRMVLVDRSPLMREAARRSAPEAEVLAPEALGGAVRGCVVAVELFDALPVHRLRRRGDRLVEVCVGLDGDRLVELEQPPPDAVRELAERYRAAAADGTEAEVAVEAPALLDKLLDTLERGVVIVVDYGDEASRLYGASRPRGTLLAYHRHSTNEDYFERVGEQDLTAHVNFSLLADRARERGAHVLGMTTQDRFLIANGILEAFEADTVADSRDPRRIKQRLQALPLIHPGAMGRAFKVLMLARGCVDAPVLAGVRDPFAR